MKTVLFIAYHFPPLGGVGPQRILRLLPHLKNEGWNACVLTVAQGLPGELRDESLLQKIPQSVSVFRAPIRNLGRPLQWLGDVPPPDRHIGWLPAALRKVQDILRSRQIDAIVSTSAPYTAHLVGWRIKRQTQIPWIVDLRDEWSDNPVRRPVFSWQGRVDRWLEARVFSAADRILMTTPRYCRQLAARLPMADQHKVSLLTNGFDRLDFATPMRPRKWDGFQIVHSGSLYGPQNPKNFLKALASAIRKGWIPYDRIQVTFIGRVSRAIEAEAFAPYAGDAFVQRVAFASHDSALRRMRQADALLLLVGQDRGEGNIPAKTFEYLAAGKPLLALVDPQGDAAQLLREANAGMIVHPEETALIESVLVDLYQRWAGGFLRSNPHPEQVNRYEARALTKRFVHCLNGVAGKDSVRREDPVGEVVSV